jgi:hypothetical protein
VTSYGKNTSLTAMSNSGEFTFEAWCRRTSSPNFGRVVVESRATAGGSLVGLSVEQTSGKMRWLARNDASTVVTKLEEVSANDGVWHHYVGVNVGGYMRLWKDGVEQGSPTAVSHPGGTFTSSMRGIAASPQDNGNPWNGDIDEVALYDRALTEEEILEHYEAGAAILPPVVGVEVDAPAPIVAQSSTFSVPSVTVDASAPAPTHTSSAAVAPPPTAVDVEAPIPAQGASAAVAVVPASAEVASPAPVFGSDLSVAAAPAPSVSAAVPPPEPPILAANKSASGSTNSAVATATLTESFEVGDTVIVALGRSGNNQTVASVTDTQGNVYRVVEQANAAANNCNAVLAVATVTDPLSPGDVVTATWSTTFSSTRRMIVLKATGLSAVDPVAPTSESSGTGTAWSGGSVASNRSGILLGVCDVGGSQTNTPPSGWGEEEVTGGSRTLVVTWNVEEDLGTFEASGTLSASTAWQALSAMLRSAGGDDAVTVGVAVEFATPAPEPSTFTPGGTTTINAVPAAVDVAAPVPTFSDFPGATVYEDATATEDPLSRSGAWLADPLGLTNSLRATAGRVSRKSGQVGRGVYANLALNLGTGTVDVHGTVGVRPGAGGAYLEHGVVLAAGRDTEAWDGYVVGLEQATGIYIARAEGGVLSKVTTPFQPNGVELDVGDAFGMRLHPVAGGVLPIEVFVKRAGDVWIPVVSYGDPDPHTGQANLVTRINGNASSGSTTTSALDDLAAGQSAAVAPPSTEVGVEAPAPTVTFPGVPVTVGAAPASISVAGVPPRDVGLVEGIVVPPATVEFGAGDNRDRDVRVDFAVNAPTVQAVTEFLTPGSVDLTANAGGATLLPGQAKVRPGSATLTAEAGGARLLPGPITRSPGSVELATAPGGAYIRPATLVAQPGSLDLATSLGAAALLPGVVVLRPGSLDALIAAGGARLLPQPVKVAPGSANLTLDAAAVTPAQTTHATLTVGSVALLLGPGAAGMALGVGPFKATLVVAPAIDSTLGVLVAIDSTLHVEPAS